MVFDFQWCEPIYFQLLSAIAASNPADEFEELHPFQVIVKLLLSEVFKIGLL